MKKFAFFCGALALAVFASVLFAVPSTGDMIGIVAAHATPEPAMAMIAMVGAHSAMLRKSAMPSFPASMLLTSLPSAIIGSVRNEPKDVEKLLADVKASLKEVSDGVKQTAEEALKQAKANGTITDELKNKADKLLTDQSKLTEAQNKLTEKVEQLSTRNADLEQKLAGRRGGGQDEPKSLGQMVGEHASIKQFVEQGAKGAVSVTVQNAITTSGASGGALAAPQRDTEVVGLPRRQFFIRQLLQQGRTTAGIIQYARLKTRTNNAGVVAEAALKPESNLVYEPADATVRTIAHWIPVSRQAMDDLPQLQSEIDGELRYGLDFVEEAQILKGDGTGQNLFGLVPQATDYAEPAGITVASKTKIDVLRLAILQASLAEYPADGIVINPVDWADIELTKDGENRYLFATIIQMLGPQLWGRPVISTAAMSGDEFLVGAFQMAAKVWDRMDTEVAISSEDRDNFVKNMLTVRAEKRLALAVKRPGALVTGDFTTAIAA
ncbi:phage major capsid protein (plasmid) [Agrobacterium rosae]|uniref:Phage major capsid protein n=1 Tax=Agrobacterium rosae TaxID=1972867 RepID=A0ABU4W7Y2_9HYPH|nr:phage major capsid protein [Agrobacterium rosae]MDX8332850.1 phage major capsid protein [Agrobacterium rosae]